MTDLAIGQSFQVAAFLVAALQQLASLLGQGDDVALVPVHRDLPLAEAATLLHVSVPFLRGLLDAHEIPASGTGDDRRVRLSDLLAYQARRSGENRRDLATRETVDARSQAKIGLIRGLYARGYERAQVLELLRLIDWLVALPAEQERLVDREIERIEEEQKMPYVTSWERIGQERGRIEGLLEGLTVALDLKFGAAGTALLPELRQITDPAVLQQVGERIKTASSVDDLRQVYDPSPGQ